MKILAKTRDNKGKITASVAGDTLRLEIDGRIGKWNKASVSDIKLAIKEYGKQVDKAHIYINSEGGDVFEAEEIANVIKANFKSIKVEVGALAASAATIFLAKFHATGKSNSHFMIHKPSGCICGNEDEVQGDLKLLKNLTKQYLNDYAGKMRISKTEIADLWKNDYWMDAKEALDKGLIDAIDDEPAQIDAVVYERMVACGVPHIDAISKPKPTPKKEDMNLEVLRAQLGLPADADEKIVQAKLNELKAKAAKAETLEATIKSQQEAQRKADIKALLDDAEKQHKINAKTRPHYEKLAEKDLAQVKAIIDDLPAMGEAPSANLQVGGGKKELGARANWTYADWAEKDPQGFEALPEEKQKALIDARFEN